MGVVLRKKKKKGSVVGTSLCLYGVELGQDWPSKDEWTELTVERVASVSRQMS